MFGGEGDIVDDLPAHAIVNGRAWVVGGGISPDKLREATGVELRHLSEWWSGGWANRYGAGRSRMRRGAGGSPQGPSTEGAGGPGRAASL